MRRLGQRNELRRGAERPPAFDLRGRDIEHRASVVGGGKMRMPELVEAVGKK